MFNYFDFFTIKDIHPFKEDCESILYCKFGDTSDNLCSTMSDLTGYAVTHLDVFSDEVGSFSCEDTSFKLLPEFLTSSQALCANECL